MLHPGTDSGEAKEKIINFKDEAFLNFLHICKYLDRFLLKIIINYYIISY